MLQRQAQKSCTILVLPSYVSNTFTSEQKNFMGQIKMHRIIEEHNPRIGEHVIASSIHKHTDILAYVFLPLAVT